jgi:hypothetical protein
MRPGLGLLIVDVGHQAGTHEHAPGAPLRGLRVERARTVLLPDPRPAQGGLA